MSEALSQRSKLHLVTDTASSQWLAGRAPTLPLQADWQRVLRDITSCGLLKQEVSNGVATIRSSGEPWYADLEGQSAWLRGPGVSIAGLTDYWAMAEITRSQRHGPFQNLDISDYFGNCLLRLTLMEDSNWDGFNTLLVRQWARRSAPLVLPGKNDLASSLNQLAQNTGLRLAGTLYDNWYDAERRYYPGIPVDASLLAPFLETFTDQVCPLNILFGNSGLIQQHESAFFDCVQFGATLRLRSNTAEFELDMDKVVGARLVECERLGGVIRLYDEECCCVAAINVSAAADPGERDLWKSMLRALID